MNILVLGGSGKVGKAVTKELVNHVDVSKVVLGVLDRNRGESYLSILGSPKAFVDIVDVTEHDHLVKIMKRFDVIVNCVYHSTILEVTQAAIEAKVDIIDPGGFYYNTIKLMKLDEEIKRAGITLLHGCGSGPGLHNVVAKYASTQLDSTDEIHIRAGATAASGENTAIQYSGVSIRTIIDEATMSPVVYDNGEYKTISCLSGLEMVRFPDPIGLKPTYYSLHTETLTLSKYLPGVKIVDVKVVFSDEEISRLSPLVEIGLIKKDPIIYKGTPIVPREFLDFVLTSREKQAEKKEEEKGNQFRASVIWVTGKQNQEQVRLTYEFIVEHDKRWGNIKAGVPLAIGALMLGRGEITKRGFTVPEECIDSFRFIQEVKKRGFIFQETIERTRNL
jgi:lysine 6-dehydrogenase